MRISSSGTTPSDIKANDSLRQVSKVAESCVACPLHQDATQTVFGKGASNARLLFIGEQPGNDEDLVGEPFVGPAGRVLREAAVAAGLTWSDLYMTNAVKHFKFLRRGKRRLHQKPNSAEIAACFPWLIAEIARVKPRAIVCLGATAAQTVLKRRVSVIKERGRMLQSSAPELSMPVMVTFHPSAVLRQREPDDRQAMRDDLIADLKRINRWLAQLSK